MAEKRQKVSVQEKLKEKKAVVQVNDEKADKDVKRKIENQR